jgi:hypothetical protein
MRRFVVSVATLVVALALAGAAFAGEGQKPQGYQGQGESVQGELQQGVAGVSTSSGTLPFSGQDLTLLIVGGIALILVGTGFYRLSRRQS